MSSTAIVPPAPAGIAANTQENWLEIERVFRGMVARETTGAQIDAAIMVCKSLGFNPILQHINLIDGKVYVTHKGLWHLAHRSGMLDGIEVLAEGDTDSHYTARVAIYRKDMRYPFAFTGRYPKLGRNKQYGPEMALARAECLALRRAFDVSMPVYEEINWEEREGERDRPRADIREVPPAARADQGNERATERQIKFIRAIGQQAGLAEAALEGWCRQLYGCKIDQLNRRDASTFMEAVQRRRAERETPAALPAPAETAPAPPAFDFAAWSQYLDVQAGQGVATSELAAQINQLKDDLTDEQYEAVMLWFREVKDARKAGRAAPADPSGGNPAPKPLVLTDEGLLALVIDAGRADDVRADAARAFLDKARDAEALFARVDQLAVLDFPAPILDVLVEEQRERLGLPDDDAIEVAATPARAPLRYSDDELGDVPF